MAEKRPWERMISFRGSKKTMEALEELQQAQPRCARSAIIKKAILAARDQLRVTR